MNEEDMRTDDQIFKDIKEKLEFDPKIDASDIKISAKDGIVSLTGTVKYYIDKVISEDDIKEVQGVKGIVNELQVSFGGKKERSDEHIAKAAIHALEWNPLVPAENVQIIVEGGFVTLTGEVDYNYQREAAYNDIRYLEGVKSIVNKIRIKQEMIDPIEVKAQILKEFERNARLDASKIQVEVKGKKIILKGNVRSWPERELALRTAWSIPGVTDVENLIQVQPIEEIA